MRMMAVAESMFAWNGVIITQMSLNEVTDDSSVPVTPHQGQRWLKCPCYPSMGSQMTWVSLLPSWHHRWPKCPCYPHWGQMTWVSLLPLNGVTDDSSVPVTPQWGHRWPKCPCYPTTGSQTTQVSLLLLRSSLCRLGEVKTGDSSPSILEMLYMYSFGSAGSSDRSSVGVTSSSVISGRDSAS